MFKCRVLVLVIFVWVFDAVIILSAILQLLFAILRRTVCQE